MKQVVLEFKYKGNRTYVHGSDLYSKIEKELKSEGFEDWHQFELNFKSICYHNLTCYLSKDKNVQENEVANFSVKKNGHRLYGSITENQNHKINNKYDYDEKAILRFCTIDPEEQSITYNNPENTYLNIEILLAMAKYFLEDQVDNTVKWFFRRISLSRSVDGVGRNPMCIKMISQKVGFVGFIVSVGGTQIGSGYAAALDVDSLT